MTFKYRVLRLVILLAVFIAGYITFTVHGYRFGPHPQAFAVYGAQQSLGRVLVHCHLPDRNRTVACLQKSFADTVRLWGVHLTMRALTKRLATAPSDDLSRLQCHDIAHQIGWNGVVVTRDITRVLYTCTDECQAGCFHGAVDAWIATGHSLTSDAHDICLMPGLGVNDMLGCFHGLGHAIADINEMKLLPSLLYCNQYPYASRDSCASGVFMEIYETAPYAARNRTDLPKNSPYWCAALPAPYDGTCYDRTGLYEYYLTNDVGKSASVCLHEPEGRQLSCLVFLGKHLYYTFPYTSEQLTDTHVYCSTYMPRAYDECVKDMLFNSPR